MPESCIITAFVYMARSRRAKSKLWSCARTYGFVFNYTSFGLQRLFPLVAQAISLRPVSTYIYISIRQRSTCSSDPFIIKPARNMDTFKVSWIWQEDLSINNMLVYEALIWKFQVSTRSTIKRIRLDTLIGYCKSLHQNWNLRLRKEKIQNQFNYIGNKYKELGEIVHLIPVLTKCLFHSRWKRLIFVSPNGESISHQRCV